MVKVVGIVLTLVLAWIFLLASLVYQAFWQRHLIFVQRESDKALVKGLLIPNLMDNLKLRLSLTCYRQRVQCLLNLSRRRWQQAEYFWQQQRVGLARAYARRAVGYSRQAAVLGGSDPDWPELITKWRQRLGPVPWLSIDDLTIK